MSKLLALDVAVLPPPEVGQRAIRLNQALPEIESQRLRLDAEHLPHVTLTQQFVRTADIDRALDALGRVLRAHPPLTLHVSGGGKSGDAVWIAIARSAPLVQLHERLMDILAAFERPAGGAAAFFDGAARVGDIAWVTGYRMKSSFAAYTPHITLGHASEPPAIEPFTFEATTVAACHLGRFCTCRWVLSQWELQRT